MLKIMSTIVVNRLQERNDQHGPDYKGRSDDFMEAFLLKINSCMEEIKKTIGDNKGRISYLESLNKPLEGTVQVNNQRSEQVRSVPIAIPGSQWEGSPTPTDPYLIPASFARY